MCYQVTLYRPEHRIKILLMSQLFLNCFHLSQEDSIMRLNLTNRALNALTGSGIQTVGEVVRLVESGKIWAIQGLGKKSILEIKDNLAHVEINDAPEVKANADAGIEIEQLNLTNPEKVPEHVIKWQSQLIAKQLLIADRSVREEIEQLNLTNPEKVPEHVIKWQSQLIAKQLSAELLHEDARIADGSVKDWLIKSETLETNKAYKILATILGSSLNICEEIEFLFNNISEQHCLTILLSRYGFDRKTLSQIGQEIDVSRERVRQMDNELKNQMNDNLRTIFETKSISDLKGRPTLLRMQSALLIARDTDLNITYEQWTKRIRLSGLVGNWRSQNLTGKDAVEVMIAICNLLSDCNVPWIQMSENLQYAVQLAAAGSPNIKARILHARDTLPDKIKRLINRHTKHSGGVYAIWLSQEIGRELEEIKDILQGLGYRTLSKDWFIPKALKDPRETLKYDVFHKGIRKIFHYCGPVSIDDVCSGLRHILSRTQFPVPPPDVMDEIVRIHDYKCENGLYYWDGTSDQNLNAGETIIMDCLEQIGSVVHHSELVHAFIESDLSFPTLHATLKYSPLFERIETALYKIRGRSISYQDIERAKANGERQSLDPEVDYGVDGSVIVSFTVSAMVIGQGTIFSEQFPNLSGTWSCYVSGEEVGKLNVTENEFRHLKKPFELLNCQSGNRLKFIFNTWKRTVVIEKVRTDEK